MYTLVIILTFVCGDGTEVDKEEHFPLKDYSPAVMKLNGYLKEAGNKEEFFNGQKCILEDVRAGHRKNVKD